MSDRTPARVLWLLAGVLLLVYPVLRPWDDETTLAGVVAWDGDAWILSHTAAMLGLMATSAAAILDVAVRRPIAVLVVVGTAFVLPYYGAEAFGLPMVGELARQSGDVATGDVAEDFRYGVVPTIFFGVGLVTLAVAGVRLLLTRRPGAGLLGFWLVAFLPQFFAPAPVRIAHGVVALVAGVLLATSRAPREPAAD